MKKTLWYVYIIETEKGLLYTGITNDVARRFNEHSRTQKGKKGAKFFHIDSPKSIVYVEEVKNRSEATKKEIFIKKMTRSKKQDFFRKHFLRSEKIGKSIGFEISFK